jgi:exportin-T
MFETIDMLLLPLLSRIFSVLSTPATGTDDATIHKSLKSAYLQFFTALMNANLDGVFISERNKPEFENVISTLLRLANDSSDQASQRLAFGFFSKSVIAWGSSVEAANAPSVFADSALSAQSKAVNNGTAVATNQHAITRSSRAAQAFAGYESFIYQTLVPLCFEVPANPKFILKSSQQVSNNPYWRVHPSISSVSQANAFRYYSKLPCFFETPSRLGVRKRLIFLVTTSCQRCSARPISPTS